MALQLDDLAALDDPLPGTSGVPLLLPLDNIDEDPNQPRREFDSNALQELAQTIRERGVRQPISVRPSLLKQDRWLLNFGARRLRAARIAALAVIPAFVDSTADDYDQVIENEQREGLRPLDLALFVQKRLAMGDTQAEIAKRLGKSRQYVTVATALIEPPAWLLQAYREGRCKGKNELYELRRLHGLHALAVEDWVEQGGPMTREGIASLREQLESEAPVQPDPEWSAAPQGVEEAAAGKVGAMPATLVSQDSQGCLEVNQPHHSGRSSTETLGAQGDDNRTAARKGPPSELHVYVELDGQDHQLIVSMAPGQPGCFFVQPLAGGPRRVVPAAELRLRGFVGR